MFDFVLGNSKKKTKKKKPIIYVTYFRVFFCRCTFHSTTEPFHSVPFRIRCSYYYYCVWVNVLRELPGLQFLSHSSTPFERFIGNKTTHNRNCLGFGGPSNESSSSFRMAWPLDPCTPYATWARRNLYKLKKINRTSFVYIYIYNILLFYVERKPPRKCI